jgi:PAS domain S-box-containing protein
MNATAFTQQVKAMSDRLANLYQETNTFASLPPALLSTAVKELGIASERLEVAAEMLYQQNQKLALADQTVKAKQQRYQELLEFIPDACLLTNAAGMIQEANQVAARLLNLPQPLLIGKLLTDFVAPKARQQLQTQLQRLQQRCGKQEWQIRLQPDRGIEFDASVFVEASCQEAQPLALRWLLRYPSGNSQVETREQPESNVDLDYPLQCYYKGETIPLTPETIWQVRSGLVKLTTFSDSGQEVLIGLAGAWAPFGLSLTDLPLYEAIALADTQLWCISLSDFATSAKLKQRLLPQISQRLKQAELLLAICGQPRVADRLHSLFELLKQEIGQPVADGTRLSVRITHEHLASACCTTRVSITRLLSQLKQQKKLSIDSQHHMILKECDSE